MGSTVDWYCSNDNLLASLQALALIGGGDFDLVKSDLNSDALNWDFRFYLGQLGTDRHTTLTFAIGRGNMIQPVRELNLQDEMTIAIVGGLGQDADRDYLTRTGANYSANNHIEMFVSSTGATTAGRQAAADKRLATVEARELFDFGIKQTDSCVFKKDFDLGDLATAVDPFTGATSTTKINAVTVELSEDGTELISGECSTP